MKNINWNNWEIEEFEEIEKLSNEMFIQFLKKNNAYDKFMQNLKNCQPDDVNKEWNTIDSFCDDLNPERYFLNSFKWLDFEYWKKLHTDWIELLKIKKDWNL